MPLVARNSLVGRAHHILGGRWQRNWCRAALCASCCFLHGKTYHTAILQVLEQQSNVNLELKYVCGCVSTRNLGGPVDIQHAVSEWNEYKPSIYARDSIYAIWKLFICIFVNACAHQSVTNIFEYSNIRIYWSRINIRTFVRIHFSFTNIFGHSFVSNLFVRIYSDIRWWVC